VALKLRSAVATFRRNNTSLRHSSKQKLLATTGRGHQLLFSSLLSFRLLAFSSHILSFLVLPLRFSPLPFYSFPRFLFHLSFFSFKFFPSYPHLFCPFTFYSFPFSHFILFHRCPSIDPFILYSAFVIPQPFSALSNSAISLTPLSFCLFLTFLSFSFFFPYF
jgi:hypothetical protein